MEAKELRIGNKLQKGNGEVSTVRRIDSNDDNDILVEEEYGLLTLNYNLFGIQLTEEWLLKFSFEKEDEEYFHKSKYAPVLIECDNGWADSFEERQASKIINYVHQLQNLFYALTGEELTLK